MDEHDLVVLLRDLPAPGLLRGDVGTVVHRYADSRALEVEFVTGAGQTVAVATLELSDVRPVGDRDLLHVRELAVAP